jgi:hypothetical protein
MHTIMIFSMGALLELNDRAKLEQYFINCDDIDIPKNGSQSDSIFDYLVNDNGQWGKFDEWLRE